ncbi:ABC transporter permease [Anaerosacchariphilus sp. NSJ-68]|uniref:Transport permease protein n=2 Tax=Lachnospiraceae TaxID=186803 RepID=A0A923RMJ0_9FIRM|nr:MULTISPECIES: ABC transporter permease [Lachnospiraceae]MBC5660338.1 ABC transporter permease [Anaerosacchariphilus hominis]MBC5697814.1 ABC transporter permease [Roseburia difficilis]
MLSVFVKYRALIDQLVKRDIKTKYRRSVLGLLWTVLNPLLMMTVLSIVFSYFFSRYGDVENFPVYLLCGQVIFNFFNESTSIAMGSIVHSGELIKKVYVPKYLFPITKVMSSGVNLLSSMIALVIVMVVTRSRVTPTVLLAVFPLLYVLLFSTGVSLFLSAAAVSFRDLMHLYSVVTTAWMYLTPVIYPMSILDGAPKWAVFIINANPLTAFIKIFRAVVLDGVTAPWILHVQSIVWCVIALVVGSLVFKKSQDKFILKI